MTKTAFIPGQDGSFLAGLLLDKGYRVVGLVRRSTNFDYPNIRRVRLRVGKRLKSRFINKQE